MWHDPPDDSILLAKSLSSDKDLPSQKVSDEDDYLATGFRHLDSANIDKTMRCLDFFIFFVMEERYDNSVRTLQQAYAFVLQVRICGIFSDAKSGLIS